MKRGLNQGLWKWSAVQLPTKLSQDLAAFKNQRVDSILKKKRLTMRTIHRSCHRCPVPKPPPPPPSGDSRDPPRAQANFPHPKCPVPSKSPAPHTTISRSGGIDRVGGSEGAQRNSSGAKVQQVLPSPRPAHYPYACAIHNPHPPNREGSGQWHCPWGCGWGGTTKSPPTRCLSATPTAARPPAPQQPHELLCGRGRPLESCTNPSPRGRFCTARAQRGHSARTVRAQRQLLR